MNKKKSHLRFILLLASTLALALGATVASAAGGLSDGGGNAVGATLFDFYENEGTEAISPESLPAYQSVLVPLFRRLDGQVTNLVPYLKEGLTKKSWYLEPKPIQSVGCVNSSMIAVDKVIVACQSEKEIRISAEWFNKADAKNQAGLILHELLVDHILDQIIYRKGSRETLEASVRRLVRLLFAEPAATGEALQKEFYGSQIDDIFYKTFLTQADVKTIRATEEDLYQKNCTPANPTAAYDIIIALQDLAGSPLSLALSNGYMALAERLRPLLSVDPYNHNPELFCQAFAKAELGN